jgi:hypothetical protein
MVDIKCIKASQRQVGKIPENFLQILSILYDSHKAF